jgi:hypothetical protein
MSNILVNTIKDTGNNTLLSSDGSGNISSGGAITNTPAFEAYKNADQNLSDNTLTKVTFNVETFDTNSAFDLSNDKFIVPTGHAGKYFIYARLDCDTTVYDIRQIQAYIYKNGSGYARNFHIGHSATNLDRLGMNVHATLDLAVNDYIEVYVLIDAGSSAPRLLNSDKSTMFGAYKLIGA